MSNIAELIIRGDPTTERQKYAEAWAQKSLSILQATRKKTQKPVPTCEAALAVALFNAGILREVRFVFVACVFYSQRRKM